MDKKRAIDVLIAAACCDSLDLDCRDCPLYDTKTGKCGEWTRGELVEAVRTLNGERKTK